MNARKNLMALVASVALLTISAASAQTNAQSPRMMGHGMGKQGMMEQHRQMMSEWKARDAELQKKVEAMNGTQGQAKIDAMAGVINQLVQDRERMFSHMQKMHESMSQQIHEGAGAERDSQDSERKEHKEHHENDAQ